MTKRWVLRIVAAAAVYGAAVAAMVLAGMGPRVAALAVLVAALAVGYWVAADVGAGVEPARWAVHHVEVRNRGNDTRVDHLRWRLAARPDPEVDVDTFAPMLIELIDERVAATHGVDRVNDPDAFERIVGPELAAFVASPPTGIRAHDPRYLAGVLSRIESL